MVKFSYNRISFLINLLPLCLIAAPSAPSQVRTSPRAFIGVDAAGTPTTVEAALRAMGAQAAIVFVGTVTSVRCPKDGGSGAIQNVVEIRFAVEQGLRGAGDGGTYLLREWAGLWPGGEKRYQVGSRLLMLLHAPGPSGLSSPVGGTDGAIPLVGTGPLVHPADAGSAANPPNADLRWIASKLTRAQSYRQGSTPPSASSITSAVAPRAVGRDASSATHTVEASDPSRTGAPQDFSAADASVLSAQASVATVLHLVSLEDKAAVDAR